MVAGPQRRTSLNHDHRWLSFVWDGQKSLNQAEQESSQPHKANTHNALSIAFFLISLFMCDYMGISRCTTWCSIFSPSSCSSHPLGLSLAPLSDDTPSTLSPALWVLVAAGITVRAAAAFRVSWASTLEGLALNKREVIISSQEAARIPALRFLAPEQGVSGKHGAFPLLAFPSLGAEAARTESGRARRWRHDERWIRFGAREAREARRRLPSDAWSFWFLRVGRSQAGPTSMCPSFCFLLPWGLRAAGVPECWVPATFRVGFVLFFKLWGNNCLLRCLPSFWVQFLFFSFFF